MSQYRALSDIGALLPAETDIWVLAVLFYGFGDVITTFLGLQASGVTELSPLLSQFSSPGIYLALLGLKLLAFASCFLLWLLIPEPHRLGAPLGLAAVGLLVTGWNSIVLLHALA